MIAGYVLKRNVSCYFFSYSWINERPDESVLQLVAKLRENGYEAECDVMKIQEHASINFVEMMVRNLQKAEKVIVVLPESYKKKADSFSGGVGEEYRYIISNISKETKKYILVSFDRNLARVQTNFLRCNRYNLLVSSSEDAWEGDSYQLERSRYLTSYTSQTIKDTYGKLESEQIEKIKSYPCIFAYEDCVRKNAYIGYITDMVIRSKAIKFYFQKQGVLTYDDLHKYAFEFDIKFTGSITELMHTHWTIKDVDLGEKIRKRGISV